jgi:hypothetical protein
MPDYRKDLADRRALIPLKKKTVLLERAADCSAN